ncbi:MAG: tRNA (adenosine(37)-N6)-threonylcarbamoyltransferase complex dimerization subunit type 1 TsaB [Alphaproteobacteria bacterium TMED87]|nr:tRNA (adenosine(37)-N6)-threonylcarbamoyltransferase complex dimerization subunit type 1 TsaB [Rhodospirillaceae bacterium]OUV10440.1 MAG: tRNA (adenosine(37)-N6)-threonylcarbamoyltransferase complex dimerization subunit type 1 TsaB [Alphaproteobacteria bacterium TMED87]|tara:strand:+ start:114 stop:761 length:648 start_codon:yes stop_codon:yes gene_type:complete
MITLSFDTSMSACSVAIHSDSKRISNFYKEIKHGQSELIIPAIQEMLNTSNICYSDIDKLGVTVGPGSFTGIRVAVATARAIKLATNIECIAFTTTSVIAREALLENNKSPKPIAVVVDARREEIFFQRFDKLGMPIEKPSCILPKDACKKIKNVEHFLIGDRIETLIPYLKYTPEYKKIISPSMDVLNSMIVKYKLLGVDLKPTYIRAPDVKIK